MGAGSSGGGGLNPQLERQASNATAAAEANRELASSVAVATTAQTGFTPVVTGWNAEMSASMRLIESRPFLPLVSDINATRLASEALAVSATSTTAVLASTGPTWGDTLRSGLASTWSPENVSNTIMSASKGGGGLLGGIQALGAQMGGTLASSLQERIGGLTSNMGGMFGKLLNGALGIALPLIGPAVGKLAGFIAGKLGGVFKRLFGGPSKEVQDARAMHDGLAKDVVLTHTSSQERLQDFLAHGWAESSARVATYFQDQSVRSGRSLKDAEGYWLKYQRAMEAGNTDLMQSMIKEAEDWTAAAAKSTAKATKAVTDHAKKAESEHKRTAEAVKRAMKSGDAALEHSKRTATAVFERMGHDARVLSGQWDEAFRPRTVTHTVITRQIEHYERVQAARRGSGGGGSNDSPSYGGERADGGPVRPGYGYIVGEKGPEYFIPRQSGSVLPAAAPAAAGRSGETKQEIRVYLDSKEIVKKVVRGMPRHLDIRGFSR